jgi:hypothetical protein
MPTSNPSPRPQNEQVVNPAQNNIQPNRNLESKMDRLMFGALTNRPKLNLGHE